MEVSGARCFFERYKVTTQSLLRSGPYCVMEGFESEENFAFVEVLISGRADFEGGLVGWRSRVSNSITCNVVMTSYASISNDVGGLMLYETDLDDWQLCRCHIYSLSLFFFFFGSLSRGGTCEGRA